MKLIGSTSHVGKHSRTANQQNYLVEGSELAPAAKQGAFASPSGLGADLNKEQWHEDPYADEAAKVKAEFYKNNEK